MTAAFVTLRGGELCRIGTMIRAAVVSSALFRPPTLPLASVAHHGPRAIWQSSNIAALVAACHQIVNILADLLRECVDFVGGRVDGGCSLCHRIRGF
jgi:hypothetical protein